VGARRWLRRSTTLGAFRRAELAGLDTADVRPHPSDGLHITVRAAKNDPGRAGQVKAVPYGTEVATYGPCAWARWRRSGRAIRKLDKTGRVLPRRLSGVDGPTSARTTPVASRAGTQLCPRAVSTSVCR